MTAGRLAADGTAGVRGAPPTGPDAVAETGMAERTRWGPVIALGLAMLVVTSEMTIAAVTLPGLDAELGVGPAATEWVLLAYALPMAAIAVPAGRWTDGADVRSTFTVSTGCGCRSTAGVPRISSAWHSERGNMRSASRVPGAERSPAIRAGDDATSDGDMHDLAIRGERLRRSPDRSTLATSRHRHRSHA